MFLLKRRSQSLNNQSSTDFTFHNVSIKTLSVPFLNRLLYIFTFHNVSIKTFTASWSDCITFHFTFHNVSIKTRAPETGWKASRWTLHSTMFLLKPVSYQLSSAVCNFTFHNVSIKTHAKIMNADIFFPLHSTMFLLKPNSCSSFRVLSSFFTFHNVSIKTA